MNAGPIPTISTIKHNLFIVKHYCCIGSIRSRWACLQILHPADIQGPGKEDLVDKHVNLRQVTRGVSNHGFGWYHG